MQPIDNMAELAQPKIKKFEILKAIEKREIKKKSFRVGFVFGLFTTYFMIGLFVFAFLPSKKTLLSGGLNFFVADYFEEIIKAIPDGYVTRNKEKVMDVFDEFVNSAAKNNVSKTEYRQILQATMNALQDGTLQYQELDNIINLMEIAAKGPN
jgi:hypothetical protein